MFARNAIRTSNRALRKSAFLPATRGFKITSKFSEGLFTEDVHVVHFEKGQRVKDGIAIDESKPVAAPAQGDVEIKAVPLKAEAFKHLTPTLKKFTLSDKVAVITGGARGLGYNMAQALAEVGVRGIAIMDVSPQNGEKAAKELGEQTGIDTRFYRIDVRDGLAMGQTIQDVVDHYGQIDTLINAAGIADSNIKAEVYDHEMWRRLMDINVNGTFFVAQAVGQNMIKSGRGGSIINIASMSASVVNYPQEQSCYNASKAAVVQFTKSLAAEWAKHGIRVNAISPGYMDTALNRVPALDAQKRIWVDQTPQKRLGAVDDLNNLAVFLASDGSSFMTGSNCLIDGGYTVW